MLRATRAWLPWRVQRKAKKNEAADARERLMSLCLRCHSPAERLPTGEER